MSKKEREAKIECYKRMIIRAYCSNTLIDKSEETRNFMPPPKEALKSLHNKFSLCGPCHKRPFRVFIVEKINNYRVLIQIPDGKEPKWSKNECESIKNSLNLKISCTELSCDFNVWMYEEGNIEETLKLPKHEDMFDWFNKLAKVLENKVIYNMVKELILKRRNYTEIISKYCARIPSRFCENAEKFLATLKWIALQEDVNYGIGGMGSKYTLAAYVLLNEGFTAAELRRVLRGF